MSDPVIDCSQMQLAFVAWQVRQSGGIDSNDLDLDKDGTSASAIAFRAWWNSKRTAPASLKELCFSAWKHAAGDVREPTRFEQWWQTVLDAQPVVAP